RKHPSGRCKGRLNMDYTWHKRWIGFGEKTGGQAVVAGFESVVAEMWNLGDLERFTLTILSQRWGLGLVGSTGLVAVVGWGFREPYEFDGVPSNECVINDSFK